MASLPLPVLLHAPFSYHRAPTLSRTAISPQSTRLAAQSYHSHANARLRTSAQADELRSHAAALQDCAVRRALRCGQELHARLLRSKLQPDTFLLDSLLKMYCKCGRLLDARRVFDGMPHRDVVAWTAMVSAHAAAGDSVEALNIFRQMIQEGLDPNGFTLASVLKACSVCSHSKFTHQVHGQVIKLQGLDDPYVGSSLVEAYTSSGEVDAAETVLLGLPERSDVSWNALLNEYARRGDYRRVMQVFDKLAESGDEISKYTLPTVLKCCMELCLARSGQAVHALVIKRGLETDNVLNNCLIEMYSSCCLTSACLVFDQLKERDAFTWTVIMSGYAKTEESEKVIEYFRSMLQENRRPNDVTLAVSLGVCSDMASLGSGLQLHSWAIKSGWNSSVVSGALVDMYAKCGSITDAERLFYESETHDQVAWNIIICAYSQHGHGYKALDAFRQMVDDGKRPDDITFVGVLSACSHAGLLDEGRKYFKLLSSVYGITPTMEHYACMIDILSKAGRLVEAESLINMMPLAPDSSIWRTILGACRIHGNTEIAERAAEKLFELEPQDVSSSILLSNIYADLGRWGDVNRLRNMLLDHGIKKEPGCSWIEINGQIHVFLSQDGYP
ncbi:hypothetical protein ACQ4PT_047281 [Festuca glaucescens]